MMFIGSDARPTAQPQEKGIDVPHTEGEEETHPEPIDVHKQVCGWQSTSNRRSLSYEGIGSRSLLNCYVPRRKTPNECNGFR